VSKTTSQASVTAKRFVVCGDNVIARSTKLALLRTINPSKLDYFPMETDARERVWQAGDSSTLSDSTHLIYVTATALMPDQLFRIHCRFRPNESQDATIDRRGPGWSGGIVFVGPVVGNLEDLTKIEPFSRITVGHAVIPAPFLLKDLLLAIAQMRPIYPDAWKDSLMALDGLANLKTVLRSLETACVPLVEHLQKLMDAILSILDDRLLDKLLAHREVVGELRLLVVSIQGALASQSIDALDGFSRRIREILADYL
jgi:hypothetical protein